MMGLSVCSTCGSSERRPTPNFCSDAWHHEGRYLTPFELARELGMERRKVVELCVELGVPIFEGRINAERLKAALEAKVKGQA